MAAIRENKKNGKIISYRFTLCLERDAQGKQIRRYTTWTPPEGLTPAKAKKAAERAADAWEDETRRAYQEEQKALACGAAYHLPPEKRHDDFCAFVNEIWFPLHICGNCKPTTTAYYKNIAKVITDYFKGCVLQEISPIQIQKYLIYLQTKYKTPQGKPLAPKSVRHHYGTLTNIFGYADKQEMLVKNPMQRVDAPKKVKKAIDALTPEQAKQFFALLPSCDLDFRCMLHLFITTGIRRGEYMGIQWQDIDFKNNAVNIARCVTYTPESGVIVSTPQDRKQHSHDTAYAINRQAAPRVEKANTGRAPEYHSEIRISFSKRRRCVPAARPECYHTPRQTLYDKKWLSRPVSTRFAP